MTVVTLKDLAVQLGLDKSAARKWLLQASARLGFEPARARSIDTRGQNALAWSQEQAEQLIAYRQQLGFPLAGVEMSMPAEAAEAGVFYLIRLAPDIAPNRIKVGFASILDQRLRSHRCAAPTCEVEKTWPCRRSWEPMAIAAVAAGATRRLSDEAFDVDEVAATVVRLDRLFALVA